MSRENLTGFLYEAFPAYKVCFPVIVAKAPREILQ
jgi:hypothetical protein